MRFSLKRHCATFGAKSIVALTLAQSVYAAPDALDPAASPNQASAKAPTTQLSAITVKGQWLSQSQQAFSASALDQLQIRTLPIDDVDAIFEQIPGAAVRDFGLGGVANSITLRGFGGGGHGGDLGAVVDGVPLNEAMSHADGYFDLNVLVPLEIERFSVLKGPVSALYGNFNRAGLLQIQTRRDQRYRESDYAVDSQGGADAQFAMGHGFVGGNQANFAIQHARTDGFRPSSQAQRSTVAGRYQWDVLPALSLAFGARVHNSDADSAAYLLRSQFMVDRDGIDPRVQNDGAKKDFRQLRVDANWAINDSLKLLNFAYGTQQDFTRWFTRPVNTATWRQREETYDRQTFGLGSNLNGQLALQGVELPWTVGIEAFRESTEFLFFDGLNARKRTTAAVNNRDTRLNSLSAFTELNTPITPSNVMSFGLRADRFTGGCRRLGSETGSDPCGALNGAQNVSPKLGFRSDINAGLQLRASWAEGFALANNVIKYSIGGQPLDETVFRQSEIGMRVLGFDRLDLDLAVFRLNSSGEVRTVAPGIFENFGATTRRGAELSMNWQLSDQLSLSAVHGASSAKIRKNADVSLLGKRVPGVPKQSSTLGVSYAWNEVLRFDVASRRIGRYAINAPNTELAGKYQLFDLGINWLLGGAQPYQLQLNIDNASNARYATNELLIANQRLVAPGAERSFRLGVKVDF